MLIDTHCHLDPHYFPEGADETLARARSAGVTGFVCIGVGSLEQADAAIGLAVRRPDCWATVGVHPHEAASCNAALEAAYTAKRREPGQPILATVDGRIALRPVMDGDGTADTLVVERFDQLWPNESCGARGVTHELEGTRWVLTRLGDEVVTLNEGQRELSLALERGERRVAGYAGCNRLIGAYELDGQNITFRQMALTRMACPDMKYENAFGKALEATRTWKIAGPNLEHFDENGQVVARFEERNL